jgi:protoporphyrinogen oxidase
VNAPRVAIIGAGLLGMTAAYRLSQAGVDVTVYEGASRLGGLAGTTSIAGVRVDRYYHVTLPTDERVIDLAGEVGLGDRFRFRRSGVGFYQDGRLASMSTARELLTFPGLSPVDKARLAGFVASCQLKSGHDDLDDTPLTEWLERRCGRRLYERLWKPLLDSKFDGTFDDLPATYLWSRTRRMSKTRDKSSNEVMGTLEGGYQTLVDALAERIRLNGHEVLTRTPVTRIASSEGRAIGVVTGDGFRPFDHVVSTLLPAATRPLLTEDLADAVGPDKFRYLGVVCLVMRLRRSLSPWYTLNITDRRVPLTTVVETTHVVDPERVGGSLIYAPKYVNPNNPDLDRPAEDVTRDYMAHVRTIFPGFDPERDVIGSQLARTRRAEPVHRLGVAGTLPDMHPAPGLSVASSAHVYPEIVNGQAAMGVAERLVEGVMPELQASHQESVAA